MKRITLEDAERLIKGSNGTIFNVTFLKNDGTLRKMLCRLGVTSHLKGGESAYDPAEYDLICVFDMVKSDYRSIRLTTLKQLVIHGETYRVI